MYQFQHSCMLLLWDGLACCTATHYCRRWPSMLSVPVQLPRPEMAKHAISSRTAAHYCKTSDGWPSMLSVPVQWHTCYCKTRHDPTCYQFQYSCQDQRWPSMLSSTAARYCKTRDDSTCYQFQYSCVCTCKWSDTRASPGMMLPGAPLYRNSIQPHQ